MATFPVPRAVPQMHEQGFGRLEHDVGDNQVVAEGQEYYKYSLSEEEIRHWGDKTQLRSQGINIFRDLRNYEQRSSLPSCKATIDPHAYVLDRRIRRTDDEPEGS